MIDRDHPLVGTHVVYRDPRLTNPEQGVVTAVNAAAGVVFVSYGGSATSKNTPASRLTLLDGSPVSLEVESTS